MSHLSNILSTPANSNDSASQSMFIQAPMSQAIVLHKPPKSQSELDFDDCKLAMNDFKGKIRDAIVKHHNGVCKSSLQAFTKAVESLDIEKASKVFLLGRMQHAMAMTPDIKKKHGHISFSSSAYTEMLIETLMDCKARTGAVYRNNTKHPLRSRPDKKQHYHPYAKVGTKGKAFSLPMSQPHQPTQPHQPVQPHQPTTLSAQPPQFTPAPITDPALSPLQTTSTIVNLDDPVFKQRIRNLAQMSKMTMDLLDQYEAHHGTNQFQNKEQLRAMVDNQWKCMRMSF